MKALILLLFCVTASGQIIVDRFTKFPETDAILLVSPDVYTNNTTIDATAVSQADPCETWDDLSGNGNDFASALATDPSLDLTGTEGRAINFGNDANATTRMSLSSAAVGLVGIGVDEFTVIFRMGSKTLGTGIIVGKVDGADTGANWYAEVEPDGQFRINTGGNETANISKSGGPYSLYILVVDTTNWTFYEDGVQLATAAVGTDATSATTDTRPIGIGAKHGNGDSGEFEIDIFAFIPTAITSGERAAIEAQFQVN